MSVSVLLTYIFDLFSSFSKHHGRRQTEQQQQHQKIPPEPPGGPAAGSRCWLCCRGTCSSSANVRGGKCLLNYRFQTLHTIIKSSPFFIYIAQYYKSHIFLRGDLQLYSNTTASVLRPLIQLKKNSLKTL